MSLLSGPATRLSVYLHADARSGRRALSEEIISRAHDAGLAGASRFCGIAGYGASGMLHTDVDPDVMSGLPCLVEIVDPDEARIRAFLPRLAEVLDHGLVTVESVEIALAPTRTRTAAADEEAGA